MSGRRGVHGTSGGAIIDPYPTPIPPEAPPTHP